MWLDRFIFTPGAGAVALPFAQRPLPGLAGSLFYASDGGAWIDDGTVWRPLLNGGAWGTQPPAASKFSAYNQGTGAIADDSGALIVTGPSGDTAATNRGWTVPADGQTTDYAVAAIAPYSNSLSTAAYPECGIVMREGNTGKMITMSMLVQTNGDGGRVLMLATAAWSDFTTEIAAAAPVMFDGNAPMFLRLRRNPIIPNYLAEYSPDGRNFVTINSFSSSAFTSAPTVLGVWTSSYNAVARMRVVSFASGH